MHSRILFGIGMFLVLALTACALLTPPEKQRKTALDDFMYALRWQRYPEAATYFTSKHRQTFLGQIDKISKDLNVTDVRLKRLDLKDEGRRAEAVLEMDYYLLPSATLKTLKIDQTWIYFEVSDAEANGFLITTPFPEFPEESSRHKGTLPP
ncbi:MAG: hypothetical protein NDI73_06100 [Desulfuromonadales bacterium]|nr:hypothetical protein [Desulfuromonadales bacterium]